MKSDLRKFAGHVVVPAALVATGILIIFLYPFRLSDENVTIDVMYMQYACGDCYVQYRVLKAGGGGGQMQARTSDNESDTPTRFIGWDVVVLYKDSDKPLLEYVEPGTASRNDCASPVVRLSGQFRRKLIYMFLYSGERYDGIYFDADTASIVPNGIHGCRPSRRASIR
ncbi:hypothetical protein CupriaWKF_14580 [Cupriavidus sp. WKF15]|uniref:hypothetical protein n=1 Tax=Cupriavidus sp. WKF15 TaxID=3032282 RepID=UPI0023E0E940|nr:hypothetical protein [Cupriavidus sp. WKF15]WER45512.1 hypothetical protein CupriaWKF_14580 [Cupriavidus sp. WKF15]